MGSSSPLSGIGGGSRGHFREETRFRTFRAGRDRLVDLLPFISEKAAVHGGEMTWQPVAESASKHHAAPPLRYPVTGD